MTSPNHPEGSSNMVEREAIAEALYEFDNNDAKWSDWVEYAKGRPHLEKHVSGYRSRADAVLAALAAQPVGEPEGWREVPWWTDEGSVREARRVFQEGRAALLRQKAMNTHLVGVYEPIIAALEPMLSTLAALASPPTNDEGRSRDA